MTTEEKVRTQCTACGQRMRLKTKHVGKAISCPTCKETFVVKPIEDGEATGSELPAASGSSDDSPWGEESQENGHGAAAPFGEDQQEDDMLASIPPIEDDEHGDERGEENLHALTDASLAEDGEDNLEELPEPSAMDEEGDDSAAPATMSGPPGLSRGPRRAEEETIGASLPAKVKPSKHFEPLVSQEEAALGEFKIGRAGLLTPEQTRLLVTDKNLYTHRTRRMLLGLIPGADVWTAAYPLDSADLRRLRIYLPSVGRMLLVFLLALLLGGLAFFGLYDIAEQANEGADRVLISAADLEAVEGDVAAPVAEWYLEQAGGFELEAFGSWWWVLVPFLLAFLWYAWRFKARLESDAFNLPLGRGKKKVRAARDAMQLVLQHRARLQNQRGA